MKKKIKMRRNGGIIVIALIMISFISFTSLIARDDCSGQLSIVDQRAIVKLLNKYNEKEIYLYFVRVEELGVWFGECEITVFQYLFFDKDYHSEYVYLRSLPHYKDDWPALNVSFRQAQDYCRWLNRCISNEGYEFRLPRFSEWTIVARCGDNRSFPWGNIWPPDKMTDGVYPNYRGQDDLSDAVDEFNIPFYLRSKNKIKDYYDGHPGPAPVRQSGRNEKGIYGMGGNAAEWCHSKDNTSQCLRGGSYVDYRKRHTAIEWIDTIPERPYPMLPFHKDKRSSYTSGFRIVMTENINSEPEID